MTERPSPNQSASEDRRVVDPMTQLEVLVPPGITDERAIEHTREEHNGELRRIRFFVDWGHNYPLWESSTDKYAMDPDDYGISLQLGQRLNAWSRLWQQYVHPLDGWDTQENNVRWLTTGDQLVRLLEIEVYDIAVVLPQFRQDD